MQDHTYPYREEAQNYFKKYTNIILCNTIICYYYSNTTILYNTYTILLNPILGWHVFYDDYYTINDD